VLGVVEERGIGGSLDALRARDGDAGQGGDGGVEVDVLYERLLLARAPGCRLVRGVDDERDPCVRLPGGVPAPKRRRRRRAISHHQPFLPLPSRAEDHRALNTGEPRIFSVISRIISVASSSVWATVVT
jgi:hypothetical protein